MASVARVWVLLRRSRERQGATLSEVAQAQATLVAARSKASPTAVRVRRLLTVSTSQRLAQSPHMDLRDTGGASVSIAFAALGLTLVRRTRRRLESCSRRGS